MLSLLIPALGCGLMMAGCMYLMRRSHDDGQSVSAEELAKVRQELADLRRQVQEPADTPAASP
ncbi:MAG: hypothetical protein ABIV94_10740 [Acidimicrobiales bacterium]